MGRALRAWRGTRTIADAAASAGLNVDTLSDLEAGKTWPRNKTLRLLESAYGQPAGELDRIAAEAEADAASRPPAAPPREFSADLQELMRQEVGDELAAALIAHYGHLVSGRTPPAAGSGDAHPRGSAGTNRRSAG